MKEALRYHYSRSVNPQSCGLYTFPISDIGITVFWRDYVLGAEVIIGHVAPNKIVSMIAELLAELELLRGRVQAKAVAA